jgi:hypothetical protein
MSSSRSPSTVAMRRIQVRRTFVLLSAEFQRVGRLIDGVWLRFRPPQSELHEWMASAPEGCCLESCEPLTTWVILMAGPDSGEGRHLYEGEVFRCVASLRFLDTCWVRGGARVRCPTAAAPAAACLHARIRPGNRRNPAC